MLFLGSGGVATVCLGQWDYHVREFRHIVLFERVREYEARHGCGCREAIVRQMSQGEFTSCRKGAVSVSWCCAGFAALVVVWWLQWKNPSWRDGTVGAMVRESSCVGMLQDVQVECCVRIWRSGNSKSDPRMCFGVCWMGEDSC